MKEGMRLTSPFSGPLPRISPKAGFEVANRYIPPGTTVSVMQCQIHVDERIFRQPRAFQPERWFEDHGGRELDKYFLGVRDQPAPLNLLRGLLNYSLTPIPTQFSTGPRSCIGKNVAILEMKLLLYSRFRRYDLSLSPTTPQLGCLRLLVTKAVTPVWVNVRLAEPTT